MSDIPVDEWVWYGYPCHLIVSAYCLFHMGTRIGNVLVSTVGDYRPDGPDNLVRTLPASPGSYYETMVFLCDGEDEDGDPNVIDWGEIDVDVYDTHRNARNGHRAICEKWASAEMQEYAKRLIQKIGEEP